MEKMSTQLLYKYTYIAFFQMHYATKVIQWFWELKLYLFAMDVCVIELQPHIGVVPNATKIPMMEFALTVSPESSKNLVRHNDN